MLKVGQKAPDFALNDTNGNKVKLSGLKGKNVVLYFYPKDMTPGCTIEACNIRDNYNKFKNEDIVVFGISADDEVSHKKFTEKHNLPFPLLADVNAEISKKYMVYREKNFMGKTFLGIKRTTFVIGKDRKIKNIIESVDVNNHAEQIFEALAK